MIHFDTKASAVGQAAAVAASFETRMRQAAMVLTLAVGVPLVLAWFGLLGWGVLWLAKSALAL
ncbi:MULTISPECIES: hypothetical protein [Methylobacterium]|uniref:hypothetical protein n=1 Tax=Methylobacterium TaxID=407 RepID=UPI0013EC4ABA|nr:hypothetical protein [Methylobacterium sp. DB0501]NGM33156.1 hypothetical protein [Methylobacterium sp. DB0501]